MGELPAPVTPLAEFPRVFIHPIAVAHELLAEPSVLFLVVVLSPLLFLPLVSPRKLLPALPCLSLAMIAEHFGLGQGPGIAEVSSSPLSQ